jgi:hypothetical protein
MNRNAGWIAAASLLALTLLLIGVPALAGIGKAFFELAYAALISSSFITKIIFFFAVLLVLCIGVLLLAAGLFLISKLLLKFGRNLQQLAANLASSAKEGAIDAGAMAVLALLSAAVAFQSTDDFLDHVSTIKIFALAAFSYAILKALMLIPVRPAKWLSATLTLAIFCLSMAFLIHRHDLAHPDALVRFAAAVKLLNFPRAIATIFIVTLSFLSLSYPVTPTRWKRLWH